MRNSGILAAGRSLAVLLALLAGGCARTMPEGTSRAQMLRASALDPNDSLESFNRGVLNVNVAIYNGVQRPLAGAYVKVVPEVVRSKLEASRRNLDEPRIFVNNLLQLRGEAAYKTFGRFLVNSTLGIGGLIDVATEGGLPRQTGDFGQTLYVWGVQSGPYVVLPLLGPSTVRDAFGTVIDTVGDPGGYAVGRVGGPWATLGVGAYGQFIAGAEFDDVLAGSIDPYPRLRSIYLQKRAAQLGDAVGVTINPPTEPNAALESPPPPARPAANAKRKRNAAARRR